MCLYDKFLSNYLARLAVWFGVAGPNQPTTGTPAPTPVGHERGWGDDQGAGAGGAPLDAVCEQHPHAADALESLAQPHAVRLRRRAEGGREGQLAAQSA